MYSNNSSQKNSDNADAGWGATTLVERETLKTESAPTIIGEQLSPANGASSRPLNLIDA
jgi:hypothetical protein